MNARTITLTATAVTVLVVLGYAAQASPQLKEHATTAAIVLLAVMSISGILVALIAPFMRIHTVAHQHRHTGSVEQMANTSTGVQR